MQCPSKEELVDCLLGKVATARANALLDHAETCESCSRILDEMDQATDTMVNSLGQSRTAVVSDSCERMIDRAEIYGGPELLAEDDGSQTTKQHLLQGTKVRDYEIVHPIGEGGMGAVFLARHSRLKRDVALKVLSLRRSGDREAQRRFEQEMTIVGKLQHPGIVRALDAGEHDGVQYLVMELIDGADLRQIVDALGSIPLADACEITRLAAIALHYAHEENLIHRDVKPSNIMLQKDGAVKVMDLGLARFTDQHRSLTSTQQAMGSLDFMAPEQLRAAEVDRRADIYGLACTLHFLLMGEPPEKRRTASLMVSRTPKLEALKNSLPPPLTKLMLSMLAADRNKRCDSLAEVADQLAPFCNRADLAQLATKATKLVQDPGGDTGDSITSDVTRVREKGKRRFGWKVWMGLAAVGVAALALASALPGWLGSGDGLFASQGTRTQAIDLHECRCTSSNIDPTDEIPLFQVHDQAITQIAFSESTSQLICGSEDSSISIRDLPNQSRIVTVVLFAAPIKQLRVVPQQRVCLSLDEHGNVACLQLPAANTKWTRKWISNSDSLKGAPDPPTKLRMVGTSLELWNDNGFVQRLSLDDGAPLAQNAAPDSLSDPHDELFPALGQLSSETIGELFFRGRQVEVGLELGNKQVCIVDDKLVRFVDKTKLRDQKDYEYFIYAEHDGPITSMLGLPEESMVATGDTRGVVRLWHLPGQRPSYMLLSCVSKLESISLTALLSRGHWSRKVFSNSWADAKLDHVLGEMRVEAEIERNGLRHVLENRIPDLETVRP